MHEVAQVASRPYPALVERQFQRLDLHGGIMADDFCDFASELREELLHYPGWKPIRLGYAA